MPDDTPLDLLARELGARTGRIEREHDLRLTAAIADFDRRVAQFELRVAEFEHRAATAKDRLAAMVSPELAAEVARAMRALHEAPLLAEYKDPPLSPKVIRIERDDDGNLVPVYDELSRDR